MAVSAYDIIPSSSSCVEKRAESFKPNLGRNCESSNISNRIPKNSSSKKERGKKPEMPRYRPGMGLQNKNSKTDDCSLKTDKLVEGNGIVSHSEVNAPETTDPQKSSPELTGKSSSIVTSSKNTRNRRPDIQVYMPKAKVAAQINERKQDSIKHVSLTGNHDTTNNNSQKKKSNQSNIKINYTEVKEKCLQREPEKDYLTKCSNSSSPQPTGSWADLMEASDLSNSRSTPEDQLYNGHCDDSQISRTRVQRQDLHNKVFKKNFTEDYPKKQRSRRNSLKGDSLQSNQRDTADDWKVKNSDLGKKEIKSFENDFNNHVPFEKGESFTRNRHVSGNTDHSVPERNHEYSSNSAVSKGTCSFSKSHILDNKSKLEKKKRDKVDQRVPPRFQKNKTQCFDNFQTTNVSKNIVTGQNGIGGILKLPTEIEVANVHSETLENKFCMPNGFLEPQTFIHKLLFDPNNPTRPEIINIPAPVPSPHMSYPRMSPPYYTTDSLSHSYISPPVQNQNVGYIPPPQPATLNRQYHFMQPEIALNAVPNTYLSASESPRPPIPCPVPVAPLNTFPRPPACYNEHPAVVSEPIKRSSPEIGNIPAPVSSPHMSFARKSPSFYASNSMRHSSPVIETEQCVEYIPLPTVNHHNCLQPDTYFNAPDIHLSTGKDTGILMQYPDIAAPLNTFQQSACYNDIFDIASRTEKIRLKPIVERNLHEIVLLEKELLSLTNQGSFDINLNALKQCRWKLQLRFENIILADPKYCAEKNPEQSLWKSVYYQIIESLRKKLEDNQVNHAEIKDILMNIIMEGTMFYENLLEKQQETYGFKLMKVLELEHISSACLPEQLRYVLISVQKSLIYLGDLARYKEQVNQTANYGKARSWYLKAQQIAPKNGRPYHQLAILAFNTRRKLDAVYYYMRSLAASNPFLSAKESLLSLFEEAKKKYEQYEKKRTQQKVPETDFLENSTNERSEIWVKRDGSSGQRPVDKNIDSSDLKKLSDVELNKRFVISFLHVHGKLFTKVGMESFSDVLRNMLKEFYFLLQRTPLPLTSARILQLLAINIFSVTNSSLKENGRERGGSSLLQEQALYTGMSMMSLLMNRCHLLHIAHKASSESSNKMISAELAQLLPAVKIWTDWMSCQKCLWAPPPPALLERLNVGYNKDVWESFADLLTALREVDTSTPHIVSQRTNDCDLIILAEDSTFAGFVPLLEALHEPAYALHPFDKDRAKDSLRISRIQFFGDYLCGISPPCMEFDIESKKFVSLMDVMTLEESFERSVLLNSTDESLREENFDDDQVEESLYKSPERDELQVLWSRKEALSKAKEQQEKHKAQVQAVLLKHQSQRPIVLKIEPKYLIPDTNCFIDHLQLFRNILASSDFYLIIPLVVINELDGLARGTRVSDHSTPEHASKVTVLSREALHFLEQQFASKQPHLRAITSKGSLLDRIIFRSEEMGDNKGTNDDLILNCCLSYCKDRAEMFMPKNCGDPVTLFREVVLLTDDRNLRVKALAHHVPVRDLLSFLQWANS